MENSRRLPNCNNPVTTPHYLKNNLSSLAIGKRPSGNLLHSYWTWPSRNSGFSHWKWWIFPYSYVTVYQRVKHHQQIQASWNSRCFDTSETAPAALTPYCLPRLLPKRLAKVRTWTNDKYISGRRNLLPARTLLESERLEWKTAEIFWKVWRCLMCREEGDKNRPSLFSKSWLVGGFNHLEEY